jgi:MSHA biogenesis protein MshQ
MTGQSNDFVVKPYTINVGPLPTPVTTVSGTANPGKTTEAGFANNFVSAGTPFKVSVQSINQSGAVTPNFGKESPSQSQFLTLATNSIVYPTGGSATALSYTANSFSFVSAGTYSNATVTWPQVGSMTIMPGLSNYLATGSAIGGVASSTVGRFYPDHYRIVPGFTSAANSCGSFSYMGQPNLQIKPYIVAESAGTTPVTVSNYDNTTLAYGGVTATLSIPVYAAEDNSSGVSLSSRLSVTTGKWLNGVYSDSLTGTFARQTSGAPDGPYSSLRTGVSAMTDPALIPFDIVGAVSTTKDMLGSSAVAFKDPSDATKYLLNLRYGRLRLDDAFGPETFALNVNFATEYWTGNHFSLNVNDSCTAVPRSAITYPAGSIAVDTNRTVALTGGSTQGTYANLTSTNVQFNAGTAGQVFTSPAGGTGRFVVSINLTALPWLRFDWNQDGDYSDTLIPNATFEFGSYRGNDRIIYWRERLQ